MTARPGRHHPSPARIRPTERQALTLLATGHTYRTAAHAMGRSERSVKKYVATFTERHALRSTTHAVAYAVACGWIALHTPTPTRAPVPCLTLEHARTR